MPWTETARREYRRACPRYASDLTDREWPGLPQDHGSDTLQAFRFTTERFGAPVRQKHKKLL